MRLALHWQILIAMTLGAVLGIGLNHLSGDSRMPQPIDHPAGLLQLIGMEDPIAVPAGRIWTDDSPERMLIQVEPRQPSDSHSDRSAVRRIVVGDERLVERWLREDGEPWPDVFLKPGASDVGGGTREIVRTVVPTLDQLRVEDPEAYALFEFYGRSKARAIGDVAQALGNLFLRMLKMISVPLIITSLISGITGLGQAERLGKMFGRTLAYYLSTSMLAIVAGLLMVNLIRPGVSTSAPSSDLVASDFAVEQVEGDPSDDPTLGQPAFSGHFEAPSEGKGLVVILFEQVQNMIPPNPFHAVVNGQFLSIIAFSLAFGVCTLLVGGKAAERISELVDAAFQVMMKLTMLVIRLAPTGVFFLMLAVTATQGAAIFGTLGWYMVAVASALALHALVVLPMILHWVARRNPREFAQAMSPALLTAFSSASSNGTLPLTLTCVEKRAGIPNRVGSFVLPLGATVNMDGTALYEVVAVLFIAQFSGIELALSQQIIVAFTALLASIGAAGIPHAGLVMMVIILQAVGLPTESQGLIIAVDRVLDMARTAVNVWSDSCGCAVVNRFEEGE
jgi:Na+/H+-dicarboxylate symporter